MAYEKSPLDNLYHTKRWDRTKLAVIDRCNGRCSRCGNIITGKFITHHIKVASEDNFFDIDNLTLLCFDCHQHVTFHDDVKRDAVKLNGTFTTKNVDLIKFQCYSYLIDISKQLICETKQKKPCRGAQISHSDFVSINLRCTLKTEQIWWRNRQTL